VRKNNKEAFSKSKVLTNSDRNYSQSVLFKLSDKNHYVSYHIFSLNKREMHMEPECATLFYLQ